MSNLKLKIKNYKSFIKIITAGFLILINLTNLFAQYRGAPVKKDRLIKVLRSRQLQTRDIVAVINSNGVDFNLTADTRQALIAAGARPEVIQAVSNNLRIAPGNSLTASKADKRKIFKRDKPVPPNYDDLLDQALYSYKDEENPKGAVKYLEAAVKMNPKKSAAYQMLGFVNLYGLNDLMQAEKLMKESITNGGSAVFRVYHDDNGNFNEKCSGSLYISPESIRFESDDNRHTFETSTINIDKIKLDHESTKIWKNHSVFKVFLKIGKDRANFRFAPISGVEEESRMVGRFIRDSKIDSLLPNSAMVYQE
jgi:tetratricopeptide (TPR) repeat protein